jgi:hypothetical protein
VTSIVGIEILNLDNTLVRFDETCILQIFENALMSSKLKEIKVLNSIIASPITIE